MANAIPDGGGRTIIPTPPPKPKPKPEPPPPPPPPKLKEMPAKEQKQHVERMTPEQTKAYKQEVAKGGPSDQRDLANSFATNKHLPADQLGKMRQVFGANEYGENYLDHAVGTFTRTDVKLAYRDAIENPPARPQELGVDGKREAPHVQSHEQGAQSISPTRSQELGVDGKREESTHPYRHFSMPKGPEEAAQDIVKTADAKTLPKQRWQSLNQDYDNADPATRKALLKDPTVRSISDQAANSPSEGATRANPHGKGNVMIDHIGQGGSSELAMALGYRKHAIDGIQKFSDDNIKPTVQNYSKQTQHLNWMISNYRDVMSPQQLQKKVNEYIANKGPDWKKSLDGMEKTIGQHGVKLQNHIDALQKAGGNDDEIKKLLNDPNHQIALSSALDRHPEIATENHLKQYARYGETGRKLLGAVASAYIKSKVIPDLQGIDPTDPASVQRAKTALRQLDDSALATAFGVDKSRLRQSVDELVKAIPKPGDTGDITRKQLKQFNDNLSKIDGFEQTTGIGKLFRAIGLATAATGLLNSANGAPGSGDPVDKTINLSKIGIDSVGLTRDTASLLGVDNKLTSQQVGQMVNRLSMAANVALGAKAFSKGEHATAAALWGTTAATGAVTLASGALGAWAGPVGFAVAVTGMMAFNQAAKVDASNKYMKDPATALFLQGAGFTPEATKALVDQSGESHSPVPLLVRYAELKGYDMTDAKQQQKFVKWVNDMPIGQLENLRQRAHKTLDHFGGDVDKFSGDTALRDPVIKEHGSGSNYSTAREKDRGPYTVGEFDSLVMKYGGTPLPRPFADTYAKGRPGGI